MIISSIFHHAQISPQKIALYDGGDPVSYATFAHAIVSAREIVRKEMLRPGSTAVLMQVPCRFDGWVFAIALRSLGFTTLAVRSGDEFTQLDARGIGCIITTSQDAIQVRSGESGCKVIRIPDGLFIRRNSAGIPDLPSVTSPVGGHIRLTSGTTGARKKVLLSDAVIVSETRRRAGIWQVSPTSVIDAFSFALWTGLGYYIPNAAWTAGACVVFDQRELQHCELVDGTTHAFFTPAMVRDFLRAPERKIAENPDLRLIVGGGPLPLDLYLAARAVTPNVFTILSSGEVGPWAFTRIETPEDLRSHSIVPSMEVQVVDGMENPLPAGEIGAVRVRANGIGGYVDNEEASNRFFRQGYFYPGDLGTFLANGRLALRGRFTNVINVSGDKVSAEPIELALQELLAVEEVCVLSIPRDDAGEELHIAIQSPGPIDRAAVDSAVRQTVRGFSSAQIHAFKQLPRVEMGKVDRRKLRAQICGARLPA